MDVDEKTLRSVKKHSEFFTDLAMQEYEFMQQHKPSVVAIASLICARRASGIEPEWCTEMEQLTDCMYEGAIKQCVEKLYKVYDKQFSAKTNKNLHNKENHQADKRRSESQSAS